MSRKVYLAAMSKSIRIVFWSAMKPPYACSRACVACVTAVVHMILRLESTKTNTNQKALIGKEQGKTIIPTSQSITKVEADPTTPVLIMLQRASFLSSDEFDFRREQTVQNWKFKMNQC